MVGGSWKSTTIRFNQSWRILVDWAASPEDCCHKWFHCEPPTTHQIVWDFSGEPSPDADPTKIGF